MAMIGALASLVLLAAVVAVTYAGSTARQPDVALPVRPRQPAAGVMVVPGSAEATSARLAGMLFARAPAVIVANAPARLTSRRLHP
jgi:hypothetical protein